MNIYLTVYKKCLAMLLNSSAKRYLITEFETKRYCSAICYLVQNIMK